MSADLGGSGAADSSSQNQAHEQYERAHPAGESPSAPAEPTGPAGSAGPPDRPETAGQAQSGDILKQVQAAAEDLASQAGRAVGGAIGSVDSWVDAMEYAIGLTERHDWPTSATRGAHESSLSTEKPHPPTSPTDKPGETPKLPEKVQGGASEQSAIPAASAEANVSSTVGEVSLGEQAPVAREESDQESGVAEPREKSQSDETLQDKAETGASGDDDQEEAAEQLRNGLHREMQQGAELSEEQESEPLQELDEEVEIDDGGGEVMPPNISVEASEQNPGSIPPSGYEESQGSDGFNLTVKDLRAAAGAPDTGAHKPFSTFNATTPPGEALFWSGFGGGGATDAKELAHELGLQTLGMMLDSQHITPPDDRDAIGWGLLSYNMALSASGTVYVTAGDYLHSSGVWARIEKPTLMNNPDVTSIVAIDPYSGVSRMIFTRE